MAIGILAVSAAILIGLAGETSFAVRILLALVSLGAAVAVIFHWFKQVQNCRIDISGSGQIRVASPTTIGLIKYNELPGSLVEIVAGSLISGPLLLIRLKDSTGRVKVLPILRDSVSEDAFRRLSVACRWIAAQNNRNIEKI